MYKLWANDYQLQLKNNNLKDCKTYKQKSKIIHLKTNKTTNEILTMRIINEFNLATNLQCN